MWQLKTDSVRDAIRYDEMRGQEAGLGRKNENKKVGKRKPLARKKIVRKTMLLTASLFNIGGGILILLFLGQISSWTGIFPVDPPLFQYFVGGTAITFGIGYWCVAISRIGVDFLKFGAFTWIVAEGRKQGIGDSRAQ